MKRLIGIALALLTVLAVAGCKGDDAAKTVDVAALGKALFEEVEFERGVEALDGETALLLYGLDGADVKAACVYAGAGGTSEEIAVFEGAGSEAAARIKQAAETRVEDLRANFEDYVPEEAARVDHHVLRQTGNYVVLCIAADKEKVNTVIDRFFK